MEAIAKAEAHGKVIEIWFADEARIGQKNKITRRWAKRGTRPSAPKPGTARRAIGAFSERWPLIHMTPEEAVRAHGDLAGGGGLLVPVHWATFNLGFHGWAEPAQRLASAAERAGVRIAVPRPGGRVDVARSLDAAAAVTDWWTAVG